MGQSLKRFAESMLRRRDRYDHLKEILEDRRQSLLTELHGRLRGARAENLSRPMDGQDFGELADADMQDDIRYALLELKAETLNKIDDALRRLEDGDYGVCHACGDEITASRLRALPFASRCVQCEAEREVRSVQAPSRRPTPLFQVSA